MNRLSGLFHKKIYLLWNRPESLLLTVHCSRRQQSTVNSQHHSGVTGNDITYCIKVGTVPKVALFFESGIKSVKSSESKSVAELLSFATTTKQKKPGFLDKPGF
jgi:hypothetical protein